MKELKIYSLLSLIITYLLFDTEFTSITPGPPIRMIFHFLELILKKLPILYQGPKVTILRTLKFATRVASVSSNLS